MAMKCEACGFDNPMGMRFCGNCGRPLAVPAVEGAGVKSRNCVSCGRPIGWDANICMYCGYDYRAKPKKGTEGHLLTGAILTLLAGIMGVALLVTTTYGGGLDALFSDGVRVLSLSCAILGIIGGYAALSRRWFPIAVLGAAAAIFTPAFFFAIPGLILIANSATRFKGFEGNP
jgi:predicted nucleic acid-binding Zn ribbon protein